MGWPKGQGLGRERYGTAPHRGRPVLWLNDLHPTVGSLSEPVGFGTLVAVLSVVRMFRIEEGF